MRLTLPIRAEPGEVFAPYAWAAQIGQQIPLRIGEHVSNCALIAAEVVEHGAAALLTIDTDEVGSPRE